MPAYTERQRRAAGADVGRCESGKEPIRFPCKVARDFARKGKRKKMRSRSR